MQGDQKKCPSAHTIEPNTNYCFQCEDKKLAIMIEDNISQFLFLEGSGIYYFRKHSKMKIKQSNITRFMMKPLIKTQQYMKLTIIKEMLYYQFFFELPIRHLNREEEATQAFYEGYKYLKSNKDILNNKSAALILSQNLLISILFR